MLAILKVQGSSLCSSSSSSTEVNQLTLTLTGLCGGSSSSSDSAFTLEYSEADFFDFDV